MSTPSEPDLALWLSWKRINEVIRGRILADILAHSVLTEPEFTLLAHIDEAGGTIRQNALANAAGWDRTRLSHLLSRMETRGYLERERLHNGVDVSMLAHGREAFIATHEPLVVAVQQHFTRHLNAQQRDALRDVIDALAD